MKHLLITGGCGFIGTGLVRHVLDNKIVERLTVFDNLSVGTLEALEEAAGCPIADSTSRITFVEADIRDAEALAAAASNEVDAIVHLAAQSGVQSSVADPRYDCEANILGTLNALEAARQHNVPRFMMASSAAPIGVAEPPIHEELACHPVSPYGASKLGAEAYCSAYMHSFGVQGVALRFGNVYGPGSGHKTSVVAKFIRRAMSGEALEIYGDGKQTRDFIYLGDLLDAIVKSVTVPDIGGEVFQIATHRETTIRELTDMMVELLQKHGLEGVEVIYGEPLVGDVRRNFSDVSKAKTVLGWTPSHDLATGLAKTVGWFLSRRVPN